ncbi:amidase [Streptomyces griseoluteus]|uniref:amidase n=1 Tax=Streptomyces griseoluteus TaxID=29306 RepID=UPI00331A4AD3
MRTEPLSVEPLSAHLLLGRYARGELRPSDHVAAVLDRIDAGGPAGSAYVLLDRAGAMAAARRADAEFRAGRPPGPLSGVPVSVKDLLDVAGLPTGRGRGGPAPAPAPHDSPVVAVLRRAGAVIVGKTRTSEDGWSASTVGPSGPATVNPLFPDRTSGGSSGGAAVAVATGTGPIAIGTDGAGSVRIPAAWCGVVGFKPTWQRWDYGPRGDRLSHVGSLTASVEDALLMDALVTSAPLPSVPAPRPGRNPDLVWPVLSRPSHLDATLRARLAALLDGPVPEVRLDTGGAHRALADLLSAGEYPRLADGPLWPGHDQVARWGAEVTESRLRAAEATCRRLTAAVDEALAGHDALALPTVAVPAFGRDEEFPAGTAARDWLAWAEHTFVTNLTGHPAVSVPLGSGPDGMPAGLQLIGRRGGDRALLSLARDVRDRWESSTTRKATP